MGSLCLFSALRYIFLWVVQIKTAQPKQNCFSLLNYSIPCSSHLLIQGDPAASLPSCLLGCVRYCFLYTSIHFTFLILVFHASCCQPSSLTSYCEKGCKKDYMDVSRGHVVSLLHCPEEQRWHRESRIAKPAVRAVKQGLQTGIALSSLRWQCWHIGQRKEN